MNVISQGEYKIPIGKREISLEEFNAPPGTTPAGGYLGDRLSARNNPKLSSDGVALRVDNGL